MYATDINGPLVVDENPEVIITRELENLSLTVGKITMNFVGEMIVMVVACVAH